MIDHRRARILQATAFDFDLSPDGRGLLADHLAGCAECRRFGEHLRADHQVAMSRPLLALPQRVTAAVESAALGAADGSAAVSTSIRPRSLVRLPVGALAWLIVATLIVAAGLAVVGSYRASLDGTSPEAITPSAPVATPQPSFATFPPPPGGFLEPGTYAIGGLPGLGMTITLPEGWLNRRDNMVLKIGQRPTRDASLAVRTVDNIYADPCRWELGELVPRLGPTADDLVAAFIAQWPAQSVVASDVTIGGYPSRLVETTVPDDTTGCTEGVYRTVLFPVPDSVWANDVIELAGTHTRSWILDLPNGRVVISATDYPETPEADRSELQQIIDSIRIDGRP